MNCILYSLIVYNEEFCLANSDSLNQSVTDNESLSSYVKESKI